jgi:hypothetical protein
VDSTLTFLSLLLGSPVMAFALALVARRLAGGLLPRALILSLFTWVAYILNTAIEPLAVMIRTAAGSNSRQMSCAMVPHLRRTAIQI